MERGSLLIDLGIEPPENPKVSRAGRGFMRSAALKAIGALVLLVLPFLFLVRTSVAFYYLGWSGGWLPLLGGVVATTLLLAAYGSAAGKRWNGSWKLPRFALRLIGAVVAVFALHGVLFVAASRGKIDGRTDSVESGFASVHPVLRLATGVLVLFDSGLVVTDTSRNLDDYRRMGLPANEGSLHLPQSTGWAHAVDLRTLGRGSSRNGVMALYFWSMGFHTLRHRGTADHLHVSLPLAGR